MSSPKREKLAADRLNIRANNNLANAPLLSICIPTFNRANLILPMVNRLLDCSGDFEVVVQDDGSADDTSGVLGQITDPRLHVSSAANQGRAGALAMAVSRALGTFTMIFDDDDDLSPEGLQHVLSDCDSRLPSEAAGYIYHLVDGSGARIGSIFPVSRSNFLELRNDLHVLGDKKEVIRTDLLQPIVQATSSLGRRVPTSLYWSMLALQWDIICRNVAIGRKTYLPAGMSDSIRTLKLDSPRPMAYLYTIHVRGFLQRRYRSVTRAARALSAMIWYSGVVFMSFFVRRGRKT